MAEPHTTGGTLILGFTLTVAGSVVGAQLDALVVAMLASICVSLWMRAIDTYPRALAAMALSTLCGAYLSPFAAMAAADRLGLVQGDPLRLACALLLGGAAPMLVPVLLRRGQQAIGEVAR